MCVKAMFGLDFYPKYSKGVDTSVYGLWTNWIHMKKNLVICKDLPHQVWKTVAYWKLLNIDKGLVKSADCMTYVLILLKTIWLIWWT